MSNGPATTHVNHDQQRALLAERHTTLLAHYNIAAEAEIAAIVAATSSGTDDAAEQRRLDRQMARALRTTTALANAVSAIVLQIAKLNLAETKLELDAAYLHVRLDERAKREAIRTAEHGKREATRTAMADDKRAAAALIAEASLARASGAAPANEVPAPASQSQPVAATHVESIRADRKTG
jgi:hypothetical protein